jgi:hypothetical protein
MGADPELGFKESVSAAPARWQQTAEDVSLDGCIAGQCRRANRSNADTIGLRCHPGRLTASLRASPTAGTRLNIYKTPRSKTVRADPSADIRFAALLVHRVNQQGGRLVRIGASFV